MENVGMTHECFFETVMSLPNRRFLQALLPATASNRSHNVVHYYECDWQTWIFLVGKICAVLLACWQHEKCVGVHFSDRVKCAWVCSCHRVWSAYVRCLMAVPTFRAQERKNKTKTKTGCLFSDVGFQAKEFHERCSLRGEVCSLLGWRVTFGVVCFFRENVGVTVWEPYLFMMGSTFAGDTDLSY